jgi:hypothetical protein
MQMTPETARNTYHFFDASEQEDAALQYLIGTARSVRKDFIMGILTTAAALFVVCGLFVYQIRTAFSPTFTVIAIALVFMYMPAGSRMLYSVRNASRIDYDLKQLGRHFLICHAACVSKNPPASNLYTVKVKTNGGKTLENAVIPRAYYNVLQPKESMLLAVSAEKESDIIAIPLKYIREHAPSSENAEADITPYVRHLTDAEYERTEHAYHGRIQKRRSRFYRTYYLILGVSSAVLITGIVIGNERLIYPFLFLDILILGMFFMNFDEDRHFFRSLKDRDHTFCIDAVVSAQSPEDSASFKTEFSTEGDRKAVFTSRKREDRSRFGLNEKVLLIYFGKENPQIFSRNRGE